MRRGKRRRVDRTTSKKSRGRKRVSGPQLGTAKLTKGDALEQVRALPEQHYSLIISSPPYNIGKIYERKKRLTIDRYRAWQEELATELVKKANTTRCRRRCIYDTLQQQGSGRQREAKASYSSADTPSARHTRILLQHLDGFRQRHHLLPLFAQPAYGDRARFLVAFADGDDERHFC
jgi:hypothetical protein